MINKASQDLIKAAEGLRLTCYLCAAGVPTIGWGNTSSVTHADVGKKTITQAEAQRLFEKDIAQFEAVVARYVKVPLTENQRGALVSFTYNLGAANLAKSTMLKRINAKEDLKLIGKSWVQWCNANGKPLAGLKKRRETEFALYCKK